MLRYRQYSFMTGSNDLVLFHEDPGVATAIATILEKGLPVDDVADQNDVPVETLSSVITELGLEDRISADLPDAKADCQRGQPAFLDQRDPISRERRGVRDDTTKSVVGEPYDVPFERALLSEAGQSARKSVLEQLSGRFGSKADRLRIAVSAVPTTRDYPNHVRWIAIKYPIDDTDASTPRKVQSPQFPFERLEDAIPGTVDVTVELAGETFTVRNFPVVSAREYWQ